MSKPEPKFIPKDGQVDFTNIRWCPVLNCVVKRGGLILLVKRSKNLRLYPGYWNGISGFLDDQQSLEEKVKTELKEELGVMSENILSIKPGAPFDQDAPEIKKTWIVHPVLVEIKIDVVSLDWEASEYKWMTVKEARSMDLLPGFENVLKGLSLV